MRSHYKRPSSTIEPYREKIIAHIKAETAKGYSRSAAATSFCKANGLHRESVLQWLRSNFILTQSAALDDMLPDLVAHISAGGNQLEFAEKNGFDKSKVCRACKLLGYSMQLVHDNEFEIIQMIRRRFAAGVVTKEEKSPRGPDVTQDAHEEHESKEQTPVPQGGADRLVDFRRVNELMGSKCQTSHFALGLFKAGTIKGVRINARVIRFSERSVIEAIKGGAS